MNFSSWHGHKFSKYFYQVFLGLIWYNNIYSADCDTVGKDFEPSILRLKRVIESQEGNRAYLLSDSILNNLNLIKATDCSVTTWVKYYKADALCAALKYEQALDLCYQTIHEAESRQLWEIVALCHIDAALCLEVMQRAKDCKRHLTMAYDLIRKYHLDFVNAVFAVRYSSYHRIYENKDTAIYYAQKAIELSQQEHGTRTLADGYLLLGSMERDRLKSIDYAKKAVNVYINSANYLGAAVMYAGIARKYHTLNDDKNHIRALDSSLYYFAQIEGKTEQYFQVLDEIYMMKIDYFKKNGLHDSVEYYITLSEETQSRAQLNFNQTKIENDVVEFAIAKEKAKAETIEQRNYFLKIGIGLISALSLVILWLFYNNIQKTDRIKNQYSTINLQNDQLQKLINKQNVLLSEVHHRVKNNLQLVISMITVLSRKLGNDKESQLLKDITTKVHSMALIHEQLYKRSDFEEIDLLEYIYEMSENFKAMHTEKFDLQITSNCDTIETNIDTAIPLGIILTELISNSIKYAIVPEHPLMINIELNLTERKYTLKYMDNGPGISQHVLYSGDGNMGFSIIKKMARQLQAQTNSYNENGAVFTIVFEEKNLSIITN